MIGGVLFPKKSNNLISNSWLKIIFGDWNDMGNLSWASSCLAHLYRSLCNASSRAVKEIDGAIRPCSSSNFGLGSIYHGLRRRKTPTRNVDPTILYDMKLMVVGGLAKQHATT
ncbi:unnamed protein product [Linum tenue]|uniref:Aminotransferase-like plant mobile domain-containing protein n=1 Tax=Linum tenue TaxID=586396 RepID=A0AAV0MG13_9ROSI|nr:unnamed protein product [Linum tenue]CAI0444581.1 unnamed protein product [Linum tenue]